MPNLSEKALKEVSDGSNDEDDLSDIPAQAPKEEEEEAGHKVNGELEDEVERTQTKLEGGDENGREDEDDDDDEVPEGEYEVEAIKDYKVARKGGKKTFMLLIKWKGFPESDNTWEPEANLNEDSKKLMEEYFISIGGRPDSGSKTAPKRRRLNSSLPREDTPSKRSKREIPTEDLSTWTPSAKNWEPEIERVETVDRDPDTKKLNAYIVFKNRKRIKVGMEMVYEHCPRTMLKFYEDHLSEIYVTKLSSYEIRLKETL